VIAFAAITLSLALQRTSFDLLDGVAIEVAVHNSAKLPATATFSQPGEYEIDILRGETLLWSNKQQYPPNVTFPAHKKQFLPGPTILAVYIWNAIEADGSTPGPGEYTVRARLLSTPGTADASTTVKFISPVPVSALEKLKLGEEVTIAGHLDGTKGMLTDATGTVPLMKRLATAAPDDVVAVRGYLTTLPNRTHAFFVERWAVMR